MNHEKYKKLNKRAHKHSHAVLHELFIKSVQKICTKFTGERQCRREILIKLQSNFNEIMLRHGCLL